MWPINALKALAEIDILVSPDVNVTGASYLFRWKKWIYHVADKSANDCDLAIIKYMEKWDLCVCLDATMMCFCDWVLDGRHDAVEFMLSNGYAKPRYLLDAVYKHDRRMIEILLQYGADPNEYHGACLTSALVEKDEDLLRLLISYGGSDKDAPWHLQHVNMIYPEPIKKNVREC